MAEGLLEGLLLLLRRQVARHERQSRLLHFGLVLKEIDGWDGLDDDRDAIMLSVAGLLACRDTYREVLESLDSVQGDGFVERGRGLLLDPRMFEGVYG